MEEEVVYEEGEELPSVSGERNLSPDSPSPVRSVGERKKVQHRRQQQQQQQQQRRQYQQHQQQQQCLPQLRFLFRTHQFVLSDELKRQPKSTDPISGVGPLERSENSPSIVVIRADSSVDGRAGQLRDAEPNAPLSGILSRRILLFRQTLHRRRCATRRWSRMPGDDDDDVSPTVGCNVYSDCFCLCAHNVRRFVWRRPRHRSVTSSSILLLKEDDAPKKSKNHRRRRATRRWKLRRDGDDNAVISPMVVCSICSGRMPVGGLYDVDNDDVNARCSCLCPRNIRFTPPSVPLVRMTMKNDTLLYHRRLCRPCFTSFSALSLLEDDASEETTLFCFGAAFRFARRQPRRYSPRRRNRHPVRRRRRCSRRLSYCLSHRRLGRFPRRRCVTSSSVLLCLEDDAAREATRFCPGAALRFAWCRRQRRRRRHRQHRRSCKFKVLLVWVEVFCRSSNCVPDGRASRSQALRNASLAATRPPGDTFDVF